MVEVSRTSCRFEMAGSIIARVTPVHEVEVRSGDWVRTEIDWEAENPAYCSRPRSIEMVVYRRQVGSNA